MTPHIETLFFPHAPAPASNQLRQSVCVCATALMHTRDFAALVLAALAAHLALSHDGTVALRKAWVVPTPPDDVAALGGADYVPPAPLIVSWS